VLGLSPFIDTNTACLACDDVYYVVEADDRLSTTAGAQFLVVYDGYNKIPLSLVTPNITTTAELVSFGAAGVLAADLWQPTNQDYASWSTGAGGDGFSPTSGESPVLYLSLGQPETRVLTGLVPAEGELALTLEPGDNLVVLPLSYSDALASELLAAIPEATQIDQWDAMRENAHRRSDHGSRS
jgi:hypothetical protein